MAKDDTRADAMLRDLKRAGLKLTPQRVAIVRLFAGDETHPTAQDLYERLLPSFPSMSFATVYNTLDALAGTGLTGVLRFSRGLGAGGRLGDAARFDPNTAPHHHAVCDGCGAVRDVIATSPKASRREDSVASTPIDPSLRVGAKPSAKTLEKLQRAVPGFSVRTVERVYRGLCARCSRERPGETGESSEKQNRRRRAHG